jgi:hypothetical protein
MDDDGKRMAKVPVILILAGFIIVVAGMKAASSILVPFFSGRVHCRHLHSTVVLAATQGRAEGLCTCSYTGRHPVRRSTLWSIDRSSA